MACSICNGKGFVPSKTLGKFSGKPIPNCFSRCECQGDDHDYLPPLKVTDFDFAMSYEFRSFVEEQATGRPLEPLEQASSLTGYRTFEPQWEHQQWQSVQQLRAQVNFLTNKVTEMRIEKKKDRGYTQYKV